MSNVDFYLGLYKYGPCSYVLVASHALWTERLMKDLTIVASYMQANFPSFCLRFVKCHSIIMERSLINQP